MRSYCAIYVDAGYLLASAATRVTGTSLRRGVAVDHTILIQGLIAQAETDSGMPLMRVNWYDSGGRPGGMPDVQQDDIGLLPRVKLRLGRLSHTGEQKGVDLRMGLDLATYARNRVVDIIYLVSGDDDLTEAVEEAQFHGLQVIILAVPGAAGRPHAVARNLQREADGVILIDPEVIDHSVRPVAIPAALVPGRSDTDTDTAAVEPVEPGEPAPAEVTALSATLSASNGTTPPGTADADPRPSRSGAEPDQARPESPEKPESTRPETTRPETTRPESPPSESIGPESPPSESPEPDSGATESGTPGGPAAAPAPAAPAVPSAPASSDPLTARPPVPGLDPAARTDAPAPRRPGPARPTDEPTPGARPAAAAADVHEPTGEPATGNGAPTPSVLAGKRPTAIVTPRPVSAPTPTWSTSSGGQPARFDDESEITPDLIDAVVRQVVTSWCSSATPESLIALRRGEPFIPGDLDRTLLLDLSSRSGVYDIDDESRHALRDTFWSWINRLRLG